MAKLLFAFRLRGRTTAEMGGQSRGANVLIGHVVEQFLVLLLWPAQGYGTLTKLAFAYSFLPFCVR